MESVKPRRFLCGFLIRMLLAWFSHPVKLEHLGHTLLQQECHPINRAAEGSAVWGTASSLTGCSRWLYVKLSLQT